MELSKPWTYEFHVTPELESAVCAAIKAGLGLADAFAFTGVPLFAGVTWAELGPLDIRYSAEEMYQFYAEIDECVERVRVMATEGDADAAAWLLERDSEERTETRHMTQTRKWVRAQADAGGGDE